MKQRRLGRTGLLVSEIGVGGWPIGGALVNLGLGAGWDGVIERDAREGLAAAIELGVTLFDTADVYGLGKSELLIGEAIKRGEAERRIKREDCVVISKVGYFRGSAVHGFDPGHIRRQLEKSLTNLQIDHLDVYCYHHLDFGPDDRFLDGAVREMERFKEEGLVRYVGLRGPHKFSLLRYEEGAGFEGGWSRFCSVAERINPDVINIRYNILSPTYDRLETDVFRWARKRNCGILINKPLAQGLLLDKYDSASPPIFSSGDHRSRKAWFRAGGLASLRPRLDEIKMKFGATTTKDLVQLSIKYCLARDETACVLVGFRNSQQARDSFSTDGVLSVQECEYIRTVFAGIGKEIGSYISGAAHA